MLRGRRKNPKALPCCLCGARIEEPGDLTYLRVFPGRTHAAYEQFWSHRTCIDEAMNASFAPDLDRDDAYGTEREDRGVELQSEPLPCCLCGARIEEPGDRIGLWVRPRHRDEYVVFWTHRKCMDEAMHPKYARQLRESAAYGN